MPGYYKGKSRIKNIAIKTTAAVNIFHILFNAAADILFNHACSKQVYIKQHSRLALGNINSALNKPSSYTIHVNQDEGAPHNGREDASNKGTVGFIA